MAISRRSLLLGTAGASLLANGCQSSLTAAKTEAKGAFPANFPNNELLGPQVGQARLSFNENPYGPAPSAQRMIEYAGKKGAYYPLGASRKLSRMIAERHGLEPENVVISAGSAEALSATALLYGQQGPIVTPRLFFDVTVMYAQRLGLAEIQRVELTSDMNMDLAAIEKQVSAETGLVQLCNPNNPTGIMHDHQSLRRAVQRMSKITTVVIDEAYMELVDEPEKNSCIDMIKESDNIIIARTFSKIYGLAGLRIGYLLAAEETASKIRSAVMSWTSAPALAAAIGCYNDDQFLQYSKSKILMAREMTVDAITNAGFEALPSQTNFIFFKTGKHANDVQAAFKEKNILISGQYMDYSEWSRVSMGRLEDVEQFCSALPEVVASV